MLQKIYNLTIRDHLPRTWGVYRGVAARDVRLLDINTHFPDYKTGFMNAIEEHVSGRSVELVGFGRGISTATALDAGATHVTAYEAADKMIQLGIETLEANRCDIDRVTVQNALVGEAHNVYGSVVGVEPVPPRHLCDADCLVLDCEGAEREILGKIGTPPEVIIVESHPYDDAPTSVVGRLLEDIGYTVTIRDHTPDAPEKKHTLVGIRQ